MQGDDSVEGSTGPTGDGDYEVQQGENVSRICQDKGLNWEAVWAASENSTLRKARNDDPNALLKGDCLHLKEKQAASESASSESKHQFKRLGTKSVFRLALEGPEGPRAGEPYVLEIDGKTTQGDLDDKGRLEVKVRSDLDQLTLVLGEEPTLEKMVIVLGELDPINEASGIQQRLNSLGFDCGDVDGMIGPITRGAIVAFQEENAGGDHQLAVDGIAGEKTQTALSKEYASHEDDA